MNCQKLCKNPCGGSGDAFQPASQPASQPTSQPPTWIMFNDLHHNFLILPNWLTHFYIRTYVFLPYIWLLNMPQQEMTMTVGEGAYCWVYTSSLGLLTSIVDHFPIQYPKQQLNSLIAVYQGAHTHAWCSVPAIWFTSETFFSVELLVAKCNVHVITLGDPNKFFELIKCSSSATHWQEHRRQPRCYPRLPAYGGSPRGHCNCFCLQGLHVDNYNKPTPKNIPTVTAQPGSICPLMVLH